jgi:shikimate kinase
MRIFLVGFMGSGKSFLGKELAQRLGFGFVDLDQAIETKTGLTISAIFECFGEAAFRQMESEHLRALTEQTKIVVSTGGGTPCFHKNMDWMNENGITIYFLAPARLLAERLLPEKSHRPLLANVETSELEAFIGQKMAERTAFYEQSHLQFAVPAHGFDGLDNLASYLKRFF